MDRFDRLYEGTQGTPAWEIDRPQRALVSRASKIRGRVLDAGCGTGENAMFFASRGCEVIGIDSARAAIASAKRKAHARNVPVDFLLHDVLSLSALARTFDGVIDSGFFHQLTDEGRVTYREELMNVLSSGATVLVLAFSEYEPDWGGPRRVTQGEIREAFAPPFFVESIEEEVFETNISEEGSRAWLATITFLGRAPRAVS